MLCILTNNSGSLVSVAVKGTNVYSRLSNLRLKRNAKHERCRSEEDCGLPAHWHIFQQLALGPTYWSGSKLSSRENLPQRRLEVVGIGV